MFSVYNTESLGSFATKWCYLLKIQGETKSIWWHFIYAMLHLMCYWFQQIKYWEFSCLKWASVTACTDWNCFMVVIIRYNASVGKYNMQFTVQNICRKKRVLHLDKYSPTPLQKNAKCMCHLKLCISPAQHICVLHVICITTTIYLYRTNQLAFVMWTWFCNSQELSLWIFFI